MNLFSRFKKDYLNYLLSIIFPALMGGIAVPLFKNLLGSEGYGEFSIFFNASIICTAITTGWITQSVYRFYQSENKKSLFSKLSLQIANKTLYIVYLPIFITVYYIKNDIFLAILLCLTVFVNSMQFIYMSIAQSAFLSRKTIYSESLRTFSYILIATTILLIVPSQYLKGLFLAIFISFSISIWYLRVQTGLSFGQSKKENDSGLTHKKLFKKFFKYGSPLSLWIVFSYLIPYVDKIMSLHHLGPKFQGNYQALFDLLYRGFSILISPIVISLLPLLTQAYERSEGDEIKSLLKKIILFELAGLLVAAILYWFLGASIILKILKIPDNPVFRLTGLLILCGTFVWQLAMVVHQRYILRFKSVTLLYMIAAAFLIQLLFYLFFSNNQQPIIYPVGYLMAATIYLLLVSWSFLNLTIKKIFESIFFLKKSK